MKQLALIAAIAAASACATAPHGGPVPGAGSVPSVAAAENVVVIPLEHALAKDVREVLDELINASRRSNYGCTLYLPGLVGSSDPQRSRPDSRIVADARTNSLLIKTDEWSPDDIAAIRELIALLDVKV
jgi:type II secretory pathway component GspD/PulD (secretin)